MGRHGLSAAATLSPAKKIGHFEDYLKDFKSKQEALLVSYGTPRDTQESLQLSWKFHATGPRSLSPPAKGDSCSSNLSWYARNKPFFLLCPAVQLISGQENFKGA